MLQAITQGVFAAIPWQLQGLRGAEEVYLKLHQMSIANDGMYDDLLNSLPNEIKGGNMTLDNIHKWFTFAETPSIHHQVLQSAVFENLKAENPIAFSNLTIDPSVIVAAGQLAWNIIHDSKPSVNANADFTSAIPDGVPFTKLQHFKNARIHTEITWKNQLSATMCEAKWDWTWDYDGDYEGVGKYVGSATQAVTEAFAAFGCNLDAQSSSGRPVNIGSERDPVAAIQMHAAVTCTTMWESINTGRTAYLTGAPPEQLRNPESGRCLDIGGGPLTDIGLPFYKANYPVNGAHAWLWGCNSRDMQQWAFKQGRLENTFSGKCLDIDASTYPADGSKVQLWDCNTNNNQKWVLMPNGEIKNLPSGKCLDINGQKYPNDGAMLTLWSCHDSANQKWRRESSVGSAGTIGTQISEAAPLTISV